MSNPNPYLEYMTPPQGPNDSTHFLQSLLTATHSFNIGPIRMDCDLDPSDGVMGITCYFFGKVVMERKLTIKDNTAACDMAMGPMNVHLQVGADFDNHSIGYQMKFCMMDNCQMVAGNLGGWAPPQVVPA